MNEILGDLEIPPTSHPLSKLLLGCALLYYEGFGEMLLEAGGRLPAEQVDLGISLGFPVRFQNRCSHLLSERTDFSLENSSFLFISAYFASFTHVNVA